MTSNRNQASARHRLPCRLTALALVLLLTLLLCACSGNSADTETTQPASASPTDSTGSANASDAGEITSRAVYTDDNLKAGDPRLDQIVATCGDVTMNNRRFQISYYNGMYSFIQEQYIYIYYYGLMDFDKPMSEQESVQEGLTWEQYFVESAISEFRYFAAITAQAKSEGFEMGEEDKQTLEKYLKELDQEALESGFENADAYIQNSFGETITAEDFKDYYRDYYYAMAYAEHLQNCIAYTDDDIAEYFETHKDEEDYQGLSRDDKANISVRHILIQPEDSDGDGTSTDEEKAAAKEKAEQILAAWKDNPTEENFAALANEHSTDGGSNTAGGLYEDVYPGQMVQTFNDWCFDDARQSGDTGIVETDYGFHIMYFVAQSDQYQWKKTAEDNYINDRMSEIMAKIVEDHPSTVDYSALVLAPLPEEEAVEE